MRVDRISAEGITRAVIVRLSRRNLEACLHMLDAKDKAVPALTGRDNDIEIMVMPEEDDVHYADRAAGRMSWEST